MEIADNIKELQPYYFATKLAEVRALVANGKDVINLGIGSPEMDAPKIVTDTLNEASQMQGAGQYQAYNGIEDLRQAFARWYQVIYGVNLDPSTQVLPLMGSKEAVMHIHLAFCNPGETVLIPNPGYPTYRASAKMLGLNVIEYDLSEESNWLPNLSELENVIDDKCKVMWVNYPHMPTGAKASLSDLDSMVAFAKRHKLLLVNDNPYSLILNEDPLSVHAVNEPYEDVLELNSLSKSHNMSGWRVGVVTGSPENISTIVKVKSNFDSGMYKPIQIAAIQALQLGKEWYEQLNQEYRYRRRIVEQILNQLGCTYDAMQSGLFVWAKVPPKFPDGEEFSDYLLYNHDVFASPGTVFGSNGKRFIRFSLCAKQELLNEALVRISKK